MSSVLLLRVEFPFELEHANRPIARIVRSVKRPMWKCMHGKRTIAFVIITSETSAALVNRLGLRDIDGIENYWCHVAPDVVVARHGDMDPLATALNKARERARQPRQPQYMGQPKRFDRWVEGRMQDRVRGAPIKMGIDAPTVRKPPNDPDGP